jgi:hypothetical protein
MNAGAHLSWLRTPRIDIEVLPEVSDVGKIAEDVIAHLASRMEWRIRTRDQIHRKDLGVTVGVTVNADVTENGCK